MEEMIYKPGISVVVCCYNSAEVIELTIKALARQKVSSALNYEVILVDNNCTDHTVPLAEAVWEKENSPYPLRVVKESRPGLIYARKTGVLIASYDILLFADDDNVPESDWVEKLADMYSCRPEVGGIGGYNTPLFEEGVSKPVWFEKYSGAYACMPPHKNPEESRYKATLCGAGLSFRTNVVRLIFDSSLPFFLVGRTQDVLNRGDDSELCFRAGLMGWKLWYEKTLHLEHIILSRRLNWDYVLRARRGFGRADVVLKLYRDWLAGHVPLTHHQLSVHICSLWEEFWQRRSHHQDIIKLKNEGDDIALRYQYLQGLTEGFLKVPAQEYDHIRQSIIEFHRP